MSIATKKTTLRRIAVRVTTNYGNHMALTRRQFLTLVGGSTAGAVVFQACGVPEDEILVQAPLEMPEDMVSGLDNWYATLCGQCPTPEGVVVRVIEGRAKKIEGNVDYPINRGKHSARCEASLQALYHPDRISGPLLRVGDRGNGQWEEISWTDALARVMTGLDQLRHNHNETSLVMATGPISGYLASITSRFVSKFGAKYISYEPLEQTTLRLAMKQVFDQNTLPDFDIENTNYLLSFGADFLSTWVSPVRYARGYGEFRQGNRERGTFVHVDPRFSMTGANADDWVYVKPGMEGLFALSMAQVIISEGLGNSMAAASLTKNGSVDLKDSAPEKVAEALGVNADRIKQIARAFAHNQPSLAIGGGSAAAHTNGLENLSAIYSLNYLVGNVGKPGGIIFNPEPDIFDGPILSPGSFSDWQGVISNMSNGLVKVLMVRGTDPMYGLPSSTGFRDATYNVPLIVSFSNHMDDTTVMADLVLPEHAYLESWGSDVPDPGPGYQVVGFQQPVVRPFFESKGEHLGTKGFADVLLALAQGLQIDLNLPGQTFKEILQNGARKLFKTGRGSVKASSFQDFWNGVLQRGGWWDTSAKYKGPIPTPGSLPSRINPPSFGKIEERFPLQLVPFASLSLTDGRGAHLPWLQATPDPITTATWRTWAEINLDLAREMDIKEGDVVKVISREGWIEALAYPHPGISPDIVSMPIGQGHGAGGRYAENRGSNVLSILRPLTDSESGALAWAATRVRIEKVGEWDRLPKFENSAPDLAEDVDQHIIQITREDT